MKSTYYPKGIILTYISQIQKLPHHDFTLSRHTRNLRQGTRFLHKVNLNRSRMRWSNPGISGGEDDPTGKSGKKIQYTPEI